jgi:NAD+ kinase
MRRMAVVAHQRNPAAAHWTSRALEWAGRAGVEVGVPKDDAVALGLDALAVDDAWATTADLALSIGGDGTMLRTVQLVATAGVPVLGVNVGLLGYLTAVEPPAMIHALDRVRGGDHRIEERMMVSCAVRRADGTAEPAQFALNEAVVEKKLAGHTVRVRVHIDGEPFTVYATDALIVSTATGSTAYNLSAGGPILSPRHRALVLTPVAPHQLFDRPLVLSPDETVDLELVGHRLAEATVDGRALATLQPGDRLAVAAAPEPARFVTLGGATFHQVLKAKFGLADR